MTTWSCKVLSAGAMFLALAACDDLAALDGGASEGKAANALPFATLARGAVTLVPAAGFCIDKRSLRASFALMARCDTLGGTTIFGAPIALMTAAAVSKPAATGAASAGFGPEGETILVRRQSDAMTLLKVKGAPPSPDMRDEFWRAIGQVGDQVVGLAIYEASGGADLGERAPDLLVQTMRRTQAQTDQRARAAQDNSATATSKPATN